MSLTIRLDLLQRPSDPPAKGLQERFGHNLRTARLQAGLTQEKLSSLSGLPRTEISKIELGQVNLSLARMQRLASVLEHSVSDLLSDSRNSPSEK